MLQTWRIKKCKKTHFGFFGKLNEISLILFDRVNQIWNHFRFFDCSNLKRNEDVDEI